MITLLLLSFTSAHAATFEVKAALPESPGAVTVYAPSTDGSVTPIEQLQDVFGLSGLVRMDDDMGGVARLRDGALTAFAWDQGGALFSDLSVMKSQAAIQPRAEVELFSAAGAIVDELGLNAVQGVELLEGGAGKATMTVKDGQGRVRSTRITHEKASFVQVIDGLPGFGGGAWVDVIFAQGGAVAAISHTVRELEQVGELPVIPAQEALRTWERRMDETGRWDLHRSMFDEIDRVEVSQVTLGYYVPAVDELTVSYEPVWQILGTVTGEDGLGKPAVKEMIWYEPASPGRELYGIDVTPLD